MEKIKKIGLISNNRNSRAMMIAKELHDYFLERNLKVIMLSGEKMPKKFGLSSVPEKDFKEEIECIISVGGDGTFLRAARHCFKRQIPVMGINVGNLGFLAEVDLHDYKRAAECIVNKTYNIEERMLLELKIVKHDSKKEIKSNKFLALNEFVIARNMTGKILDIELIINDFSFLSYRTDGIIISTPTGSTAYALSAGGPVVEPSNEAIVITPLCAHTLFTRSFVVSPKNIIKVIIKTKNKNDILSADGVKQDVELGFGDLLEFKKSRHKLRLITMDNNIFFRIFKKKLLK